MNNLDKIYNIIQELIKDGITLKDEKEEVYKNQTDRIRYIKIDDYMVEIDESYNPNTKEKYIVRVLFVKTKSNNDVINFDNNDWYKNTNKIESVLMINSNYNIDSYHITISKPNGFKLKQLSEITSISLEHSLHKENEYLITGEFIVSGNYKISDSSINVDTFSYNLPFDINIDDKYDTSKIDIDIDDFYYEIVNDNILSINIDVLIDKLEDKPLIEDISIVETDPVIQNIINEENKVDVNEFNNNETLENNIIVETVSDDKRCIDDEIEEDKEETNNLIIEKSIQNNNNIQIEKKEEKTMQEQAINNDNQIKSLFMTFDNEIETYSTYKVYLVRENDSIESIMEKYDIDREILGLYNDLSELKIGDKLIIPTLTNA